MARPNRLVRMTQTNSPLGNYEITIKEKLEIFDQILLSIQYSCTFKLLLVVFICGQGLLNSDRIEVVDFHIHV